MLKRALYLFLLPVSLFFSDSASIFGMEIINISFKFQIPELPESRKKRIKEKYHHVLEQVAQLDKNPDYMHEYMLLLEKYPKRDSFGAHDPLKYRAEYRALIAKYIPEYATFWKEYISGS